MDTYINAHLRGTCRHKISDEFFGNRPGESPTPMISALVDPHRPVSPSLVCSNEDCPRCIPRPSQLCCNICNPGSFILPVPETVAPRPSHAPNKFKVDSGGYSMTEADKKLKNALREWRSMQMQDLGVMNGDDMFGPQFIMTDESLERLVDLAHYGQIDDLTALQNQVNWHYCDRWGSRVLDVIKTHGPPQAVSTPSRGSLRPSENLPGPSRHRSSNTTLSSAGPTASNGTKARAARKPYRCGSCGSTTHIGKSFLPSSH